MNWSRGLFRAWVLGSTLWLLGWSAHLLLGWPRHSAETADCEAVKRKAPTESLTDNEMKCVAFLRLIDQRSVVDPMRYGIDADQRMQNVYQWSVIDAEQRVQALYLEDEFFVLTQSYIETFVENSVLEIKPDRTLMLRYELKSGYRADALNHFFYDSHRENVSNHVVTTTVAAFGIPAISFVLGWTILWVGRGFSRS